MTDFSKLLNPEQLEAATAGDGPILVLAAAGTGKTRTLVHRVAYLVERGVNPGGIMLLTFTNRAAREMLERAAQVVGSATSYIWSGTFHSICARLLRRKAELLGYKPGFQIIDEDEQKKLIGEIIKDSVADPKDFAKKDVVAKIISEAVNEEKPVEFIASRWQTKAAAVYPDEIALVARKYYERKRQIGVMDFDDLLINGLKLLKEHETVRERLQEHFQYMLVDEYQDTNGLQAEFTDMLAAKHRNIMAVGDDFQCIYTWRGARIKNILDFPERWPGCRVIKLERNYRSRPQILSVANAVMQDAPGQFQKVLRPVRATGEYRPCFCRTYNGKAQAQEIVKLIGEMLDAGYTRNQIAILYRSHFHSIDIEKAVSSSQIPYRLTSGIGFFEREHVKDVLALMRLMFDPCDELSFMRFVQLLPGVGAAGAKRLWAKLSHSCNPFSSEERKKLQQLMSPKARPAWTQIDAAFDAVSEKNGFEDPGDIVRAFINAFYDGYLRRNWELEEAEDRLDDLKELAADISEEHDLQAYLANVALMTNLDLRSNDPNVDRVTLSTVHQAKGMEWPVVIVPWVCEGMFPSAKAQEENRLDEERRLFYVVVTRAKDRLFLLAPQMRRAPEGGEFPVSVSPFLRDISRDLFDIRRSFSTGFGSSAAGGSYGSSSHCGNYGNYSYGGGSYCVGGHNSSQESTFVPTQRSVKDYKKMWRS